MNASQKSVQYFGMYLVLLGLVLLVVPNLLLQAFGFEPTGEPWIRVVGVVVAPLGAYYIACARANYAGFIRATIPARAWVFLCFAGLVAAGLARPILILFGAVDLAGAAWTWTALRQTARS